MIIEPRWYFPISESNYAQSWQHWYNNPSDVRAREPPVAVKEQLELYTQLRATADPEGQKALMTKILAIAVDQFYTIVIPLPANGYGIVRNNMHNVQEVIMYAYLYPSPGPTNTFTYYFGY